MAALSDAALRLHIGNERKLRVSVHFIQIVRFSVQTPLFRFLRFVFQKTIQKAQRVALYKNQRPLPAI
jgi:hypothetical protein